MHLLSEGSRLRIYHLTAAGVRLQIVFFVSLFACSRGFRQHYIEVTSCVSLLVKCIALGQSCTQDVSTFISSGID